MDDVTRVPVGPKGKHAIIPRGWHRVTSGKCQAGDQFANTQTANFWAVEDDDIGMPASEFDCLIRKDKEES